MKVEDLKPQMLITDAKGFPHLVLQENEMYHLDGQTVVDVLTAEVKHVSQLEQPLSEAFWQEICW